MDSFHPGFNVTPFTVSQKYFPSRRLAPYTFNHYAAPDMKGDCRQEP
jgi:hypothetical protein